MVSGGGGGNDATNCLNGTQTPAKDDPNPLKKSNPGTSGVWYGGKGVGGEKNLFYGCSTLMQTTTLNNP